ncbi:MAG TPA: dihydrofolate reductase family protein [Actinomycetes bacterium]|jgi:dihydrofolate reductase|nr:dihydrofolate reductase family protein [Actinomycetes bacterium]
MRLTVTTFLTLDGVYQSPGGPEEDPSGGFDQGGWLTPYVADEEFGRFIDETFAAADAFLLGRRTYEIFAAYWPQVTDEANPVASKLNTLPKYVASTTLDTLGWEGATPLRGNLAEEVAKLKRQPGNQLQVHGSGQLVQTLMERELIDEYRLLMFPVVLGAGRRLFRDGVPPAALRLVDTRTTGSGIAIHVYQAAGKPTYRSLADQPPS